MRLVASIVVVVMIFIFGGCSEQNSDVPNAKPYVPTVNYWKVKKTNFPLWLSFNGKTKGSKEVEQIARVPGYLKKVYFKPGDFVKKGQLLFDIEKRIYASELAVAKAKLAQDKVALRINEDDIERYAPLVKQDLSPKKEFNDLKLKHEEINAAIEADKANIEAAQTRLGYCSVRAEASGIISENYIDSGNMVGTSPNNSVIATVIAFNPMWVYFYPSYNELQLIQKYKKGIGALVNVTLPLNSMLEDNRSVYKGKVDYIGNQIDSRTNTITMRASVDNSENRLYPGAYVDVNLLITDTTPLIVVPSSQLHNTPKGDFVYILKRDNSLEKRYIQLLLRNKEYVIVASGLNEGDTLVISNNTKLSRAKHVKPGKEIASLHLEH